MVAYSQDGALRAEPAAANYSADGTGQYRAVKRTATGVVLCGAADVDFAGILQNDPATGENATYKVRDVSKAVAGGVINANLTEELTTDADGRLVPATTGQVIVGRPLEGASGSGVLFAMEIRPGGTK